MTGRQVRYDGEGPETLANLSEANRDASELQRGLQPPAENVARGAEGNVSDSQAGGVGDRVPGDAQANGTGVPGRIHEPCGTPLPDDADRCETCNRFVPGTRIGQRTRFTADNDVNREHGIRAYQTRGVAALPPELRETVERFQADIESDLGGTDNLTAIERGYVGKLAGLEGLIGLLLIDVRERGIFTVRGRMRGSYPALLNALDRWDRFASRLGTARRARQVDIAAEFAKLYAARDREQEQAR
jgi:hypothetical protein